MEFKIEKDIPLPPARRARYLWDAMQVGDSFFVDDEVQGSLRESLIKMPRLGLI
jgi:hypothetical protein